MRWLVVSLIRVLTSVLRPIFLYTRLRMRKGLSERSWRFTTSLRMKSYVFLRPRILSRTHQHVHRIRNPSRHSSILSTDGRSSQIAPWGLQEHELYVSIYNSSPKLTTCRGSSDVRWPCLPLALLGDFPRIRATSMYDFVNIRLSWELKFTFHLLSVLDLMKLVARCCPHSYSQPENARRLSQALLAAVQWSDSWDVPLSSSRSSAVQLCLKGLANMMGVYASPRDLSWVPQVCTKSFILFPRLFRLLFVLLSFIYYTGKAINWQLS